MLYSFLYVMFAIEGSGECFSIVYNKIGKDESFQSFQESIRTLKGIEA